MLFVTSSTISELGRKIKRKAISRTDIAFRTTVIKNNDTILQIQKDFTLQQ